MKKWTSEEFEEIVEAAHNEVSLWPAWKRGGSSCREITDQMLLVERLKASLSKSVFGGKHNETIDFLINRSIDENKLVVFKLPYRSVVKTVKKTLMQYLSDLELQQ